jgi:hypothetical protein
MASTLIHEVCHVQLHSCHQEIPKQLAAIKRRKHPLKNLIVAYVPVLVLYPLHFSLHHVHAIQLIHSGVWYQHNQSTQIRCTDLVPILLLLEKR